MRKTSKATFETVGAGVVFDSVTYKGRFEWDHDDERVKKFLASGHIVRVDEEVEELPRNLEFLPEPIDEE